MRERPVKNAVLTSISCTNRVQQRDRNVQNVYIRTICSRVHNWRGTKLSRAAFRGSDFNPEIFFPFGQNLIGAGFKPFARFRVLFQNGLEIFVVGFESWFAFLGANFVRDE